MRTLRLLGDPYSEAEIAAAPQAVRGKTELDALVAYLQGLGVRNVDECVRRDAGIAMSCGVGHAIGVIILLLMLTFIGSLDLGVAAVSQGDFRGARAHSAA